MEFLILLVIVIIIGALLGAKTFGGTVKRGCGFILIAVLLLVALFVYQCGDGSQDPQEPDRESTAFIAFKACVCYQRPDVKSDSLDLLSEGDTAWVEAPGKFKYFYKFKKRSGKAVYVRKNCLEQVP